MKQDKNLHQTYLKDCNCTNGGIIIWEGKAVCRWCRVPYAKGGSIIYLPEHFPSSHSGSVEWEIVNRYDRNNGIHDDDEFCDKLGCKIWSVLRKSDNVTFSVGEKTNCGTIDIFEIHSGKMMVNFKERESLTLLKNLSKLPPERTKLFTTSDGKDIYENEIYFKVWDDFKITEYATTEGGNYPLGYSSTTFSTRDKAIEYVKQNRPMNLSMKELASCITNYVQQTGSSVGWPTESKSWAIMDVEKLEKLVEEKTKIKL